MLVFLLMPLVSLAYVEWHIWQLLPLSNLWRTVAVALTTLVFLSVFLNFTRVIDRMPMGMATLSYEAGNSSLFIMFYLFMVFLAMDLLRLVHVLPRHLLFANGKTTLAIAALMVVVFTYGYAHYLHKERHTLELTTTKQLKRPLKMVLVSDLHIGYHNQRRELARWIDLINAEHPDLVLVGGDIIDGSIRPLLEQNMASEFRRLNAPVYACLGNHEYYCGVRKAERFYRQAGITLLRDSVADIDDHLCIAGRDDRSNPARKSVNALLGGVDRSRYVILIDHQPKHLERAEKAGVDFQFSGHTHHGQVWPASWVTDAIYEKAYGPYRRGNTHYYVSSGLGIWGGKFRIGTCSEYVVVTLKKR